MSQERILYVPYDAAKHREGNGWSIANNDIAAPALQPFEAVQSNMTPRVDEFSHVTIRDESSMQQQIKASLDASAKLFGIGLEAAYNQSSSVKFGSTTMTTILSCTITCSPSQYKADPHFRDDALRVLKQDRDAFTRRYGSYFVAGFVSQMKLSAITVYKASSKEALDTIQTSLSGGKGFVKVQAEADLSNQASAHNVTRSVTWQSYGIDPSLLVTNPGPEDIQNIFANFSRTTPQPTTTILHHYFLIAPQFDDLLLEQAVRSDVKPRVKKALEAQMRCQNYNFVECQTLMDRIRDCGQNYASLTAMNSTTLDGYDAEYRQCESELEVWNARYRLLQRAFDNAHEKLYWREKTKPRRERLFTFGFTEPQFASLSAEIRRERRECRVESRPCAEQSRIVRVSPPNALIVGFVIYSNWDDGTNGPFEILNGGVGCNNVEVGFTTQPHRGGDWSVEVWYVDSIRYKQVNSTAPTRPK